MASSISSKNSTTYSELGINTVASSHNSYAISRNPWSDAYRVTLDGSITKAMSVNDLTLICRKVDLEMEPHMAEFARRICLTKMKDIVKHPDQVNFSSNLLALGLKPDSRFEEWCVKDKEQRDLFNGGQSLSGYLSMLAVCWYNILETEVKNEFS